MTGEADWEPVRRVRAHEQVLAQIEQKILDGSLRPGQKLPSERELVTVLGAVEAEMAAAFARLPDWHSTAHSLATEHENILRAIEKGDDDRAAELVADHITRFYQDSILNNS